MQVLSKTMAVAPTNFTPDSKATAKYCEMIDLFFDCLNVRSVTEGKIKNKPFLDPYRSQNDPRFTCLIEDFLGYFDSWKENIDTHP